MEKEILNMTQPLCEMEFTTDCLGQEVLLKDGKFQVMMEWEKPYMQACIDALQPQGDVLEIGFGCGYSATHIQSYRPKSHMIIEYHPVVAERAREWAKDYPNVTIIEDTWQHALSQLGIFDVIFFDDYPLESEAQLNKMQKEADASSSLIQQGQEMLLNVEKELPFLKSIQYTQGDLASFIDMLEKEKASPEHVYRFLSELKEREQITQELFDETLVKLINSDFIRGEELTHWMQNPASSSSDSSRAQNDRMMRFLRECLAKHMRKGSRFSCFLSDTDTTWENRDFFQEIISNPDLDYREKQISIEVPEHCAYYKKDKALVIVIEKMV